MFERPHHRRIAAVLEALDAPKLEAHQCLFGGGTAMALRYGEYRESVDIYLLVSDLAGYRALRQVLMDAPGIQAIARSGATLIAAREVRADQYGIRTMLEEDGVQIKFEIVLEARIDLKQPPTDAGRICGVATLTPLDMAASKLLANSDRWRDDAVHSRDLIDLAMMKPSKALLRKAMAKAEGAYGESIGVDLVRAVERLRVQPQHLPQCLTALGMQQVPSAVVWKHIKALLL